jgi:hypothetical protein
MLRKNNFKFDLRVKTKPLNQNGDIFYAPTDERRLQNQFY